MIGIMLGTAETYAVDFSKTLAKENGYMGPLVLGEPIPAMVKLVKQWLKDGIEVVIFTAEVNCDDNPDLKMQIVMLMQKWCDKNLGRTLEITDRKHRRFTKFFDDRNVCVEANTGKILFDPMEKSGTHT